MTGHPSRTDAVSDTTGPVIIFDTNCLRYLRSDADRARLNRQLDFIGGTTVATVVNAIEATRHGSPSFREGVRETLRFLARGKALLPWPYGLLERVGGAIQKGQTGFHLGASGLEHLLDQDPSPDVLAKADELVRGMEQSLAEMHDDARPLVQAFVRARGLVNQWTAARDFLDEVWMQPSQIDDYIRGVWERVGLLPPCPIDEVRENPSWRAFFEAYGVAVFEQTVLANRRRTFGMLDLLQLVYPTGFDGGSIFVTNDEPLARAGQVVISDVVPGARVMTWGRFRDP